MCRRQDPHHDCEVAAGWTLDITIPHKIRHSHTETLGNPVEGAESQVSFAALNCAVIRAVHSD